MKVRFKADLLYFQNFKKTNVFKRLQNFSWKKIFFPKKVKLAFFLQKICFSQKLDFREKQTICCQNCFETKKNRTFPTKQRQPSYIWTKTHRARLKSLSGSLTKCHLKLVYSFKLVVNQISKHFFPIILLYFLENLSVQMK